MGAVNVKLKASAGIGQCTTVSRLSRQRRMLGMTVVRGEKEPGLGEHERRWGRRKDARADDG